MSEIISKVITPISFYIRSDGDGAVEIVALAKGSQHVYRLNDLQLIHLATDATLQMSKRTLAMHAAFIAK
jgi:hypothetical protein